MNDCMNAGVRDALPDLLDGSLSAADAATMTEHLRSCMDCRGELDLLRRVRASALLSPVIDVARIASAIPPYASATAASTAMRETFRMNRGWKIAAAAVLVAIGGWAVAGTFQNSINDDAPRVAQVSPSVNEAATTAVVAHEDREPETATTEPVQVASLSLTGGVQDLSDAELEQLLADLDGIETIPSAEPMPLTLPLDDAGDIP